MSEQEPFSVHNQPDFERVYDDDDEVTVRRGDLQGLLDLATGSMDFASGFWDEEQTEVARKIAGMLGIEPVLVTPDNMRCKYGAPHRWTKPQWSGRAAEPWHCRCCNHTSNKRPAGISEEDEAKLDRREVYSVEAHGQEVTGE